MPLDDKDKEVPEKPKSRKLLILLVLLVLLLGSGGAGAYYFYFAKTSEKTEEKSRERSFFFEMDTFMVNLADAGGKRFLKATIKFKATSINVVEECKARNFELRDLVLTLLTSKEVDEVILPEDKLKLKNEIMSSLNRTLQQGQVQDVYFTDFLVQ